MNQLFDDLDPAAGLISEFQGEFRFLSNFWPAVICHDGVRYPTVEHAFQASKTMDLQARRWIAQAERPQLAKRLGRELPEEAIRSDWKDVKRLVMWELCWQKFSLHPELKQQLLATDQRMLIEGNPWGDTYWGVCRGRGENHLGQILMQVRDRLRR